MFTRKAFPILLVLAASGSGFTKCSRIAPSDELPPVPTTPDDKPPVVACTGLDEASCLAAGHCEAVYVADEAPCTCATPGGDCDCARPAGPVFVGCQDKTDPDPCAGLDETQCIANQACEPSYGSGCGEANEPDSGFCGGSGCGMPMPPCEEQVAFQGCHSRPPACPEVTCEIYCEYGHQLDANGCAICACNPPPSNGCTDLDEAQCLATRGCAPIYVGVGCGCAACDPDSGSPCPPCECDVLPESIFQGCVATDPCAGLSEAQCTTTPGCGPIYGGSSDGGIACTCPVCDPATGETCPACDCADDRIAPPPPSTYEGCVTVDPCAGLSEEQCVSTPGCGPIYATPADPAPCACPDCDPSTGADCGTCTCGGTRPMPPPPGYAGCVTMSRPCEGLDERTCSVTPGCHPEYATPRCLAAPPCDAAGNCAPCGGPVFSGCYPDQPPPPPPPPEGCSSDADCPNGYCESYATCAAIGCPPPPPSQCVYPRCDDGSPVICAMPRPVCEAGQTAAVVNGCWACVDARSCGPTPPPPPPAEYCGADADCSEGYCAIDGGTAPGGSGAPEAPLRAGICVVPNCDDGSALMCRMMRPLCGGGKVAAIVNGCYQCVDAYSCQ